MRLSTSAGIVSICVSSLLAFTGALADVRPHIAIERFTPESQAILQLSGDAAINQNVLRLTRAENYLQGVALLKSPVNLPTDRSFSAYFSFVMSDPKCHTGLGADGIALILQNSLTAPNAPGQGVGYASKSTAVAIEFDTFVNGEFDDPTEHHVGISLYGDAMSYQTAVIPYIINDGRLYHAWIDYDGASTTIEVRLSDSTKRPKEPLLRSTMPIADVLHAQAHVGLTASTGACNEQHDIKSFFFHNAKLPVGIQVTSGSH